MEGINRSFSAFANFKTLIIDFIGILCVVLVPAISHLTAIPFYYLEPMRLMMVVALLYTSRRNAYAIAIVLPVLSFLISGHPFLLKMLIIVAELVMNVRLFILLFKTTKKPFISMVASIGISKFFCYLLYWIFLSWAFVKSEAGTTFIVTQLIVTLMLSGISSVIAKRNTGITA
jgi:hypothetical protein